MARGGKQGSLEIPWSCYELPLEAAPRTGRPVARDGCPHRLLSSRRQSDGRGTTTAITIRPSLRNRACVAFPDATRRGTRARRFIGTALLMPGYRAWNHVSHGMFRAQPPSCLPTASSSLLLLLDGQGWRGMRPVLRIRLAIHHSAGLGTYNCLPRI